MRNKNCTPRISLLALLLAIPAALAPGLTAQEQPLNKSGLRFSLGALLGLLYGEGEGIVYRDAEANNKLSQLLWDSKPLGYAGVDVGLDWQKPGSRWGFFTDGAFKFGFPGKSGAMADNDWLDYESLGIDDPDWLTDYSEHDNRTGSALLIDASIGASFRLSGLFLLKAYLAYNFIRFSWTASGGANLYMTAHGGHFREVPGDMRKYNQTWRVISPALAFNGKLNRYFDVEFSFAASPFMWCVTVDNYLLKDLIVSDTMTFGLFIEPKLVFSYTPKDFLSLSLAVSYRNISTRGDGEYIGSEGATEEGTGRVGAAYHGFDAGLIAQFKVDIPAFGRRKNGNGK
jgi:outer membrane protease